MKFLFPALLLLGLTKSAPISSDNPCFSGTNASTANQILICNADNVLSQENVDKLKLYELALPDDSACQVNIAISIKNSSEDLGLADSKAFDCPSRNCCDTIFVFYTTENQKISAGASLPGKIIEKCRIQMLVDKSNLWKTLNTTWNLEAFSRLTSFLNDLISEFESPIQACVDYEIQTHPEISSESVSPLPLIITVLLGIIIIVTIIAFIGVVVSVYFSKRSPGAGKPGFLFRNGKGETQESEALEVALPASKIAEEGGEQGGEEAKEPLTAATTAEGSADLGQPEAANIKSE